MQIVSECSEWLAVAHSNASSMAAASSVVVVVIIIFIVVVETWCLRPLENGFPSKR